MEDSALGLEKKNGTIEKDKQKSIQSSLHIYVFQRT